MQQRLLWGCLVILVWHMTPVLAQNNAVPTTNTELQRHMTSCANHTQGLIDRMKLSNPDDTIGFRHDVITALDTLVLCQKQEAEALKLRNNAQYTPPVHPYSDL